MFVSYSCSGNSLALPGHFAHSPRMRSEARDFCPCDQELRDMARLQRKLIRHELHDLWAGVRQDYRQERADFRSAARERATGNDCNPSADEYPQPGQPHRHGDGERASGPPKPSASQVILDHFDYFDTANGVNGADGLLGRGDLEAVAYRNPDVDPGVQEAARTLLENRALYNSLDSASGGGVDSYIGRADLESARDWDPGQAPPARFTPGTAAAVIDRHLALFDMASGSGQRDEKFVMADLQAVGESPALPLEARAAAQYLMNNPAAFNQIEGNSDGIVGRSDLQAAIAAESNAPQA